LRAILPCISSDSILAAIDHADWSVNEAAVELLGSRRDPDTLELLARAVVSCRSQWARVRACHAIADLARPAEAETVILSLVGEADPIVKEACLDALGQVGGVEAAIVVAGHLRSENRNLRAAAARAIGRMEIRRVPMREQDLLALLADLDIQTRAALAEVLAEASPAKVAPLAEKVLSELLVQPWTNYASGVSTDIVRLHPRPNLPRLMRLAHLPADVIALSDMAISYEEVRSSPGWVAGVNTEKGDDAVIRLCNIPGPVVTSVLERVATLEDGSVEADSNRNSLQEWPLCFEKRRRLAHAELLRRRGGTV
jgi:HEAT repeat protein